ncbi:MAG: hypothetical protein NVSMB32_06340 [Actinomycetota bacterium]
MTSHNDPQVETPCGSAPAPALDTLTLAGAPALPIDARLASSGHSFATPPGAGAGSGRAAAPGPTGEPVPPNYDYFRH